MESVTKHTWSHGTPGEQLLADTDSMVRRSAALSPKVPGLLMFHHHKDGGKSKLGMDTARDSGVRAYTLGRQREKCPMQTVGNL